MCGATVRPFSTAFFATRPAASSTPGLEVLVHEVMAAISTSPLWIFTSPACTSVFRSSGFLLKPFSFTGAEKSVSKVRFMPVSSMRSCGRFGPASDGTMVSRSSSTTCE